MTKKKKKNNKTKMPNFKPPDSFSFDKPGEWPTWRQRFLRYRTATKLKEEEGEIQVSTLVYAMGYEAENVMKSFTFPTEDCEKDFDFVLKQFDDYFVPQKNVIHERAQFHLRIQKPDEKAENFIRALYELSESLERRKMKISETDSWEYVIKSYQRDCNSPKT